MNKRNNIIYWIATVWLSLGMASTAIAQLIPIEEVVAEMKAMGIPLYLITILAVWKLLGVIAVLVPKFPLVKEWAYAGFFFLASGALFTHIAVGDEPTELFGPSLLIVLTGVSWYFRPESRRLVG